MLPRKRTTKSKARIEEERIAIEKQLDEAWTLTEAGIAYLMGSSHSLLPLDQRVRRTHIVGLTPEESEN